MAGARRLRILLTHTAAAFDNYFGDRALAALAEHGEVVRNPADRVLDDPARLAEAARGMDVVVADRATPAPASFFAATSGLLAFCRVAVDVSTVDIRAATARGVLVTHATPGFETAVAELGLGFMLDLSRGITAAAAAFRSGAPPPIRRGRELRGSTLGIIGFGAIGRRLAELGAALGMTVVVSDPCAPIGPFGRRASLPELLDTSDYVVCLAAAVPATVGLMGASEFARMRRDACFINLARGSLVDEAALLAALEAGQLAGAALDVGSAPDEMPPALMARRPDILATPHIGGLTREAVEHQAFDVARQVAALAAGLMPEGVLNPEAAKPG